MSDHDALLAAVIADPDEDTPRLVYADCVQELGDVDRAELIRVQCELHRRKGVQHSRDCPRYGLYRTDRRRLPLGPAHCWPCRRWYLLGRCETLRNAINVPRGLVATTLRGFIDSITCTAADFLAHADSILWHPSQGRPCPATAQPVRKVTLTTLPRVRYAAHQAQLVGDSKWVRDREMTDEVGRSLATHPHALTDAEVILRLRWRGIEFAATTMLTLEPGRYAATPTYVPCGAGYLPESGWAVTGITVNEYADDADGFNFSAIRGIRPWSPRQTPDVSATFVVNRPVRDPTQLEPTRRDIGTEFGPIEGRDGYGHWWRCRVRLRDVRIDLSRDVASNRYEAESVGEIERVIRADSDEAGSPHGGGIPT